MNNKFALCAREALLRVLFEQTQEMASIDWFNFY